MSIVKPTETRVVNGVIYRGGQEAPDDKKEKIIKRKAVNDGSDNVRPENINRES